MGSRRMEEQTRYRTVQYDGCVRHVQSPFSRRAALGTLAAATLLPRRAAATPEGPPMAFLARVATVENGCRVQLADGREVVLPHILPPGPDRHEPMEDPTPIWRAAAALADRVLGREVRVDLAVPGLDRYGRLRACLSDAAGDVAAGQARDGWVRVFPEPDAPADRIETLLRAERDGRDSGAGFWADGVFAILEAADASAILPDRFQILRGTPQRVHRIGSRHHLEFGADWRSDATVGIARRLRLPVDVEALVGCPVEARGWVRTWNGPFLEVTQAVQLTLPS